MTDDPNAPGPTRLAWATRTRVEPEAQGPERDRDFERHPLCADQPRRVGLVLQLGVRLR